MSAGPTRTLGEFAERHGITIRTVRFYERRGLLAGSRAGKQNRYDERDDVRLATILRAKRMGFSLAEIARLIESLELDPSTMGASERAKLSQLLERQTAVFVARRRIVEPAIAELSAELARRDEPQRAEG